MQFNPKALLVLIAFFALLTVALTSGSSATHLGEAVATVLIGVGLSGYALRQGRRTR